MKIAIGADHAGFEYKAKLLAELTAKGHELTDFGTHSSESVDYPDFAHPVASDIEAKKAELGILICGSANGVAITANKHQGIRAAICWLPELAALARQHNNANIVCIPARFISPREASEIVNTFLNTPFEGGRHSRRVEKISC
ncbi:MAG TPA: ribose 5-phosphate isomerase B [Cyclobacteriaceae bacterium]|jgi:ribose 5-phosphate isomerase B|nr:ribose 5-phosphate isomerase B [Cytophagales bacterium]HMR57755.1 ribose 5-phosphate isomerase B [Cyclobacteriaceae bacterium]HNT49033.1 ribose 5-phosphate isomerase B [Cyclobacteriaceae bacterium]HRE68564.1 ribose 5-phosphate isomerase B [Cyclobacteriaceae bacterium]HRF35209.1 ribose 5-phosphate isomerase B [Cyclobacteriaceae bacterium]